MSGFSSHYTLSPQSPSSSKSPNSFLDPTVKAERRDERGASQSGSEDGSYPHRNEHTKIEGDHADSSNTLTSQTLNADGTPKRPMNAFMIFARRRRPQVSAENQSMRTGEISKILSKEWVSMPTSEKQFYLEQAKQLKETFNTKYPDYVYRRRPNNSRKRRRSDGGTVRPVDQALLADHPDDLNGGFDLDASPTDIDDHMDAALSASYPRPTSDVSQGVVDPKYSLHQPRNSISHTYSPPEPPFRSSGQEAARLSYSGPRTNDRMGQSMGPDPSPRLALDALHYSYSQPSAHSQSTPVFPTESGNSQQGWQQRGSNWLSGGPERLPSSAPAQKPTTYSPPSAWPNAAESSPTATSPTSPSSNFFPTLNTPFYPNQPSVAQYPTNTSTNASHSISPQSNQPPPFDNVGTMPPSPMSREFSSRSYPASGPLPTPSPYAISRDSLPYSQRTLPPMQTLPGYSHSQPLTSSVSGHSGPPPAFWRD